MPYKIKITIYFGMSYFSYNFDMKSTSFYKIGLSGTMFCPRFRYLLLFVIVNVTINIFGYILTFLLQTEDFHLIQDSDPRHGLRGLMTAKGQEVNLDSNL